MRARQENGTIKIYHTMPRSWDGVNYYAGDFHLQSDEVYIEEGFLPVVTPEYDPDLQALGAIKREGDTFTYPVEDLNLNLEDVKQQKLRQLRALMEMVQNAANPYLQKLQHKGEETSQEFKDNANNLYNLFDSHKAAINAITDWKVAVKYELPEAIAMKAAEDLRKLI